MTDLLTNGLEAVRAIRAANADVFVMPKDLWNVIYTIEEITEFMRAVQYHDASDHLRNANNHTDMELEWGQAAMMWLSVAMWYNIDVDIALQKAITRIETRSQEKRQQLIKLV